MNIHEISILFAAIAGFAMVIGGMLLIWKGAIVLSNTDSSTALSIEWKQNFRLNTQAPGIAFFIVGLIFSSIAIYFSRPSNTDPIYVVGTLEGVSEQATITAVPSFWKVKSGTNGVVDGKFTPDIETLTLTITAPGYQEEHIPHNLGRNKDRVIKFEEPIKLVKVISPIETRNENIMSVTGLPPINSAPSFGVAQ
ncbi:MAG TPA: hypothetical protein DCZ03_14875 [Gammaproteobacteria bacterium]|nr:hypothetical protein [Gammaproteobacteria bacterium]